MSDLVQKLRSGRSSLMLEAAEPAADEIERLEAELARLATLKSPKGVNLCPICLNPSPYEGGPCSEECVDRYRAETDSRY